MVFLEGLAKPNEGEDLQVASHERKKYGRISKLGWRWREELVQVYWGSGRGRAWRSVAGASGWKSLEPEL